MSKLRAAVSATLVIVLGCSVSTPRPPSPSKDMLILSGLVTDEASGEPLSRVTITIEGFLTSGMTDASGRYSIEARQRRGRLTEVQSYLSGYLPEERLGSLGCSYVVVTPGELACQATLNFWMRSLQTSGGNRTECTLTGRVVHEQGGFGIETAMVQIEGAERGVLADEAGYFAMPGVPSGPQRLAVQALGRIAESRRIVVSCGSSEDSVRISFRMRDHVIG